MKNFASLLIASIFISISAGAFAQDGCGSCYSSPCYEDNKNFYAEIFGGANFLETTSSKGIKSKYQTGYIVAGSVGYRWCYGLRLEAEYAFRRNSLKKINFFGRDFSIHGHFQSSSCMANLLWDLPLSAWGCGFWNIQPFFGGGIGYDFQQAHAKKEGLTFNESKKHFAWQAIAGLSYPVYCNTNLSLEYKFHKGGFRHIYNHSVGLGLMYNFGS